MPSIRPRRRVQVADDRAHVILRHRHFDRHHRLQQNRLGLARRFLERHRTGDLERHFVRVDIVVAAVVQRDLDVDHLVAGENAALHRVLDALVDRLDVLLRNRAALGVVGELVALARLVRRDADLRVAVVTRTTGLTDVLAFRLGVAADRLAVGHLRLADVRLDLVLAHHAVDDDLQVQLAHAGDDRLARVDIRAHVEGRIFLRQLGQRHAHLLLVGLGLRLDRNLDNRLREVDRLEHHRVLVGADRVAGDRDSSGQQRRRYRPPESR